MKQKTFHQVKDMEAMQSKELLFPTRSLLIDWIEYACKKGVKSLCWPHLAMKHEVNQIKSPN